MRSRYFLQKNIAQIYLNNISKNEFIKIYRQYTIIEFHPENDDYIKGLIINSLLEIGIYSNSILLFYE